MKLIEARFVTSATDARGIPADGVPHLALVGRSNVGKSTLINALARARLARTSAAPGKTRLANLYRFTIEGGPGGPGRWSVCLADLPGYGYARGSTPRRFDRLSVVPSAVEGRQDQASVAELASVAASYFEGIEADLTLRQAQGHPEQGRGVKVRPTERYRIAGALHLVDARHPGLDPDVEAAKWLATLGIECVVVATKIDKLSRAERAKNLAALQRKLGMAALPISASGGEGLDDLWRLIAKLSRQP
jgi:GTP-binding protein